MVNVAITIAGSEASGGAGAQTDIKTFQQLGTFGAAALTCIVSFDPKNNWGHRFVPVDAQVIADQIEAITAVHPDADTVKIGMLGTPDTIDVVAKALKAGNFKNIVLDPVLICKGQEAGAALDVDNALKEKVLPLATVITPNVFEASTLSGIEVKDLETLKAAAKAIHEKSGALVVAKGGAVLPGDEAVDVLYDGKEFTEYKAPKLGERYVSGAGCTLAAAITAELAKGADIKDAVKVAKEFVTSAIDNRISPPTPFDEVYQGGYQA